MRDKTRRRPDPGAIAAYLWQEGSTPKLPTQAQGTPDTAKSFLRVAAVLPVTRSAKATTRWVGEFAANLSRVGEKANFDYIVRWIHNPRERVAPYCPKEKRDLTPDDYAKKKSAVPV
jgi:hypothetical protein